MKLSMMLCDPCFQVQTNLVYESFHSILLHCIAFHLLFLFLYAFVADIQIVGYSKKLFETEMLIWIV